jgi:PilZ domain
VPERDQVVATIVRNTTKASAECAVRDLSPDGARLVGELEIFEGEVVQLTIALAEPVELAAEIVHVDRQRKVIEVSFRDVAPEALAQINRSIAAMLDSVQGATVLVVHPSVDVSSALERDLARVGAAARVISSVDALDDALRGARFIGVILAGTLGAPVGAALQRLEEQHPKLKRILLWADQIEKLDHPAAGRVHAVLRTPWRFKGLARALDLSLDDVVTTYDQLVALKVDD